jgi:hypothetical protein
MSPGEIRASERGPVCNGAAQEVKDTAIRLGKKLTYRVGRVCGGTPVFR